MNKLSRRQFLGKSALGLGSVVIASQIPMDLYAGSVPEPVKMPLGFQVWTVKDQLVKDFPGTLKKVAQMGYQSVEMCSPPGYESSGFGPLMKLKAKEMKQIINDAGLMFTSCHYGMDELRKHLEERIDFAKESGQKQMILSSFGLPKEATKSDWLKAADELNSFGLKSKVSGIQMGYHNHNMEFENKFGDTSIYETLLNQLDPSYVKMQFQVAVITLGFKAADYFKKYPGRFISAHLSDWTADNKEVPIGKGIVDWKEFFASLKTGGVQNIFVEMGEDTFKESASYIHSLT
jgi:sugar phosphate isomerase/epimerase